MATKRASADRREVPYLTPQKVAELTGFSVGTVKKLADQGAIRCLRLEADNGVIRKFAPAWVEAFLAAHTSSPGARDAAD